MTRSPSYHLGNLASVIPTEKFVSSLAERPFPVQVCIEYTGILYGSDGPGVDGDEATDEQCTVEAVPNVLQSNIINHVSLELVLSEVGHVPNTPR